jgi:uncharacterized protein
MAAELAPLIGMRGAWKWTRAELTIGEVRNFCETAEDANPIYWDEETARASRFGRFIAPPQSLLSTAMWRWWLPDYVRRQEAEELAKQESDGDPERRVWDILTSYGYSTPAASHRKEEYFEAFGPGDGRLRYSIKVENVSAVKQTKLGPGVFITTSVDYRTEFGDRLVARASLELLRFRAREEVAS